jgi:hypothetical protein
VELFNKYAFLCSKITLKIEVGRELDMVIISTVSITGSMHILIAKSPILLVVMRLKLLKWQKALLR